MSKHFRVVSRLAVRNLRRHVRRSVLTSLAMIVGGALLMISLPLGDGTHEAWIESAVRMGGGHITIQNPDFRTSGKIDDRLPGDVRAAAEEALAQSGIAERVRIATPQFTLRGLASSASGARPAQIVGVDPESEAEFTILDEKATEGRYLEPGDRLAAYVGVGLVESLELRLGSRFVVTAQDADGEIAGQLLRVVGIFRSGVPEIDQALIHIPLETAGEWLQSGDDITNIAVLVELSGEVEGLRRDLGRELAGPIEVGALTVMGWREAMPTLDAAVRIDDFGNYLFQVILFTIIALGIVNTVLMSVLHRYREFGVLQALGLTPSQTGSLVLIEGLILTALSGVIGIALGLFITFYFWGDGLDISGMWNEEWSFSGVVMEPVIIPYFRVARVIQAFVFIVVIGALASLYPAYRAMRIDVAEAMKFER
jgi:ABC-type lipoprotein release transport system permease subunit